MLRNIGPVEVLLLLAVVILVFGVGRVAELGGALGRSIREFRSELHAPRDDEPANDENTSKGKPDSKAGQ